jgi:hypothetical protein
MREVGPRVFPYVWRRIEGDVHEAIAVLRGDGRVRVSLRRGSWSVLSGCERCDTVPVATPTHGPRTVVVPMFEEAVARTH